MTGDLVLVTGGSGFLGGHCIARLLRQGYRVRTTVRSPARASRIPEPVEIAVADLGRDEGWAEAAHGCDTVLHVASPLPPKEPRNPGEVIGPARDGTLRVLRAARDAGVRRTVLTSSFAAIGYGHRDLGRTFTEADWSDLDGEPMGAYIRSKPLAERAAWDFVAREGGGLELSVINPTGIFGPPLTGDYSLYVDLVARLLNGALPVLPRLTYGVADVRDVADLHVRAMTGPAAAGERFIATAGAMSLLQIARLLRDRCGDAARRVPLRTVPDWTVRLAARVSPRLALIVPDLGVVRHTDAGKAREVLGWRPRPIDVTIVDTARSLSEQGLLRTPVAV
ncbi:SDR family oxidoreductase [Catenuloplanes japonicus]|uniref:SDR family oxidoreductase n=1 Tax=Catenuloplanes japonicus TaxID=33876 RepID=UPI0005247AD9|nr:aldehyde reductase [Catenuloplanes japonicus]